MQTGDKVLALLIAKLACCVLLVLAAAGALGGVLAWLTDGSGLWLVAAILVLGIAITVRRSRPAAGRDEGLDNIKHEEVRHEQEVDDRRGHRGAARGAGAGRG